MSSKLRTSQGPPINFFAFIDIITGVTGILILVTLMLAITVRQIPELSAIVEDDPDPELKARLEQLLDQLAQYNMRIQELQHEYSNLQSVPNQISLDSQISQMTNEIALATSQASRLVEELDDLKRKQAEMDMRLGLTDMAKANERARQDVEDLQKQLAMNQETMNRWEARVRDLDAKLLQQQQEQNKIWLIPEKSRTSKEPLLVVVTGNGISVEQFNKPGERKVLRLPTASETRDVLRSYSALDYYIVFYIKPSGIALFDALSEAVKKQGYEIGYDAVEEHVELVFTQKPAK
jgi:hypothetical protein